MENYRVLGVLGSSIGIITSLFVSTFLLIGAVLTNNDLTGFGILTLIIYIIGISFVIGIDNKMAVGIVMLMLSVIPIFIISMYALPASFMLFIGGVIAVTKD